MDALRPPRRTEEGLIISTPTDPVRLAAVVSEPIDTTAFAALVDDPRAGAVVTFVGAVRNHDGGRDVVALDYSGHPSAGDVIREVAEEFRDRDGVHALAVVHRVGSLAIGDVALFVAVAASHRYQAFTCASDLVDRAKDLLPIWKHQKFADGTAEWSNCP